MFLTVVGMTSYTNQEMADIDFIYGVADGNAQEAQRLYGERFPSSRLPNRKTFECLHRRFRKTGSFVRGIQDTGRTKNAKKPELKERVLREIREQPKTSTSSVSVGANVNHMTRFSFNVWAGIIRDHLIGPYLLPRHPDGGKYLVFLQEVLPVLLQSVPANITARMWFQHNGAPAHLSADVRSAFDTACLGRWIGRGGPVNWPTCSTDLSSQDIFLWSHMKNLVYASLVDYDKALVPRIVVIAVDIWEMVGVFANVRQSLR
ncbi:DUF4817 domain-containing protein [Trichonephila clavipes]|nr:DUF4817 domain-containing protein [Trichonephila clavipes]